MAEKSYNGWPASPTLKRRTIEPVKGVKLPIVDDVYVAYVFEYLVKQYHKRVDDITKPHPKDDWGFAYRANRNNPKNLSCHASGTAADLDATEHPNGVKTSKTFSVKQMKEIRIILKELDNLVVWGGDFRGTPDAMHFEIKDKPSVFRKKAKKLIAKHAAATKKPTDKKPKKKTATAIAKEVIAGKWGDGNDRTLRLKKAGYSPATIQKKVNALLKKR